MKGEDIAERLLEFGVRVLNLVENLPKTLSGRHVAGQLLRCGTSAGANYEEARGGESRADFTHKMGIAWKEVREAWYWIRLIHRGKLMKPLLVEPLMQEASELTRILAKSLETVRKG